MAVSEPKSNEIQRFELLRNELMELEQRVQKSADQSLSEEVLLSVAVSIITYNKYFLVDQSRGASPVLLLVKGKICDFYFAS